MTMLTTYDILVSLLEMFSGKGRPTRETALRAIMDTKMLERTPIRDRIICMIGIFNKMEIHRAKIDGKTQVDMVLETLLILLGSSSSIII